MSGIHYGLGGGVVVEGGERWISGRKMGLYDRQTRGLAPSFCGVAGEMGQLGNLQTSFK